MMEAMAGQCLPEEPLGDWAQDDLDMVGLYTKLENEVIPVVLRPWW